VLDVGQELLISFYSLSQHVDGVDAVGGVDGVDGVNSVQTKQKFKWRNGNGSEKENRVATKFVLIFG